MPIGSNLIGFRGAAFTPAVLSPYMWYDASKGVTVSGSYVTAWADQSGNGLNLTAFNNITKTSAGLNGLDIVNLDSSVQAQYFYNTSISITNNTLTAFSVHKNNPGSGGIIYGRLWSLATASSSDFGANNAIAPLLYGTTANNISLYYNNADRAHAAVTNNTWTIAMGQRNGDAAKVQINGGTAGTGTGLGTTNLAVTRVRIGNDFSAIDSGVRGSFAENILFTTALKQDDIDRVTGYLAWKWGLVGSLAAGHPYKTAPPLI